MSSLIQACDSLWQGRSFLTAPLDLHLHSEPFWKPFAQYLLEHLIKTVKVRAVKMTQTLMCEEETLLALVGTMRRVSLGKDFHRAGNTWAGRSSTGLQQQLLCRRIQVRLLQVGLSLYIIMGDFDP